MLADRMILGENAIYSTDCHVTGLNNNAIVCGGSGCGKTMSIAEPRLLETYHSSLIATVTKRRLVKKYIPVFEQRSYKVMDLNFVNPSQSNVAYDPLQYLKSYADITFLARAVVMSNSRKEKSIVSDPYWDEAAISLLSAEVTFILMTKDNPTFADVLDLHNRLDIRDDGGQITTSLDREFKIVLEQQPDSFAVSCWRSFCNLPIKTASCVYGSLNTAIDTIFCPELRSMIRSKPKINIESLASERTVLFISTSAVNPALHSFINLFYAQVFKNLFEFAESRPTGTLPIPVHVLCDDFATGSRILNFPEYISIFREKLISVTLLIQSESQLESMYGREDSITIINNCDSYVYMGGMDLKTGHSISERLNVPLEDVLYMPIGQIVVFRRDQKPLITTRYNVMKDQQYQIITNLYDKIMEKWER